MDSITVSSLDLRDCRSLESISSRLIELPDCSSRKSMMDVDDFPKISETTESNATLQTVSAF